MPTDPLLSQIPASPIPVRQTRVARVGHLSGRKLTVPLGLGLLVLGSGVFAALTGGRGDEQSAALALPPLGQQTRMAPPQLPVNPAVTAAAPYVLQATPAPVVPPPAPAAFNAPPRYTAPRSPRAIAPPEQLGGAALLFDYYQSPRGQAALRSGAMAQDQGAGVPMSQIPARPPSGFDPTGDAIAAAGPPPAQGTVNGGVPLAAPTRGNANEEFAGRVGARQTAAAEAVRMANLDRLVPQGAIVGAVMETALDSDLPGFARALVTKDVFSFDGSAVLIPAGSRVIGEYNSGVAQGASRVFIVWSRLIRPDGVSIALGSPATDELGRGGLAGKVNRHFLQRFGGAILLSVLTGGISAATAALSRGSSVIVSTSSEATTLATQALRGTDIAPTIRTNQGALVRIFVARDLDFTAVGPATGPAR